MQIIRRHQQLQAQLRRNLHVRHVPLLPVLQVVAQVLAHLLQHHAATRRILRQLESSNVEWIFVRLFVCKGKDGGEGGGKGKALYRPERAPAGERFGEGTCVVVSIA